MALRVLFSFSYFLFQDAVDDNNILFSVRLLIVDALLNWKRWSVSMTRHRIESKGVSLVNGKG